MYSTGACTRWVGIYFHLGIYFPCRHVLLFGVIKTKIPGPSIYSPGACPRRVGIYLPCRHALLFVMIKKISGPSMYSLGACTRRVCIYFPARNVLLLGVIKKIQAPACIHQVHVLAGKAFTFRPGMCSYLAR